MQFASTPGFAWIMVKPEVNGGWISLALDLHHRLAGADRSERARALAKAAEKANLKLATLRRMLPAARYVESHAKSVGLDLHEVAASAIAIEALMRLDERDPLTSAVIRHDVLTGKISSRAMLARLKQTPLPKTQPHRTKDWRELAMAIAEMVRFETGFFAVDHDPQRHGSSAKAKMLCVDLEVHTTEEAHDVAIYLSPLYRMSEFHGRSFYDQMPYIFAALSFYDHVHVGLLDQSELKVLETMEAFRRHQFDHEIEPFWLAKVLSDPDAEF